ncbi:hypothetical protein J3F83DRAFT_742614 [Trichoderma novae-zelandiae]
MPLASSLYWYVLSCATAWERDGRRLKRGDATKSSSCPGAELSSGLLAYGSIDLMALVQQMTRPRASELVAVVHRLNA